MARAPVGLVAIGLGAYLTIGRLTAWSAARGAAAHEHDHAAGTTTRTTTEPGTTTMGTAIVTGCRTACR
jgi:hypothetical protein